MIKKHEGHKASDAMLLAGLKAWFSLGTGPLPLGVTPVDAVMSIWSCMEEAKQDKTSGGCEREVDR